MSDGEQAKAKMIADKQKLTEDRIKAVIGKAGGAAVFVVRGEAGPGGGIYMDDAPLSEIVMVVGWLQHGVDQLVNALVALSGEDEAKIRAHMRRSVDALSVFGLEPCIDGQLRAPTQEGGPQ